MNEPIGAEPASDYFDIEYRDYERQNPARKLDHYLDVIERHEPDTNRLLDVGCGRGAFLERAALRGRDWELNGMDISPEGLQATALRVPQAKLSLSTTDLSNHPDGPFDVITAWDVVEHVPSLPAVTSAIDAMLRPGGLFAFVVPVYDGILGPVIRLLDKDPTHVHKRPREFWLDWAAGNFEILEWHGIFRYLFGGYYIHLPTEGLRNQATAILVVCRKPPGH